MLHMYIVKSIFYESLVTSYDDERTFVNKTNTLVNASFITSVRNTFVL